MTAIFFSTDQKDFPLIKRGLDLSKPTQKKLFALLLILQVLNWLYHNQKQKLFLMIQNEFFVCQIIFLYTKFNYQSTWDRISNFFYSFKFKLMLFLST